MAPGIAGVEGEGPWAPALRDVECKVVEGDGPLSLEVLVGLGFPVPQGGPRGECEEETQAQSEQ
jgi:hypothetical protein